MTFIDTLNMVFITFFTAKRQLEEQGESFREDTVPFFFHMLLNKFHSFFTIYGKLEFCWEGKKSLEWRKSVYSDYKMNREKNKSNEDFQLLISLLPEVFKKIVDLSKIPESIRQDILDINDKTEYNTFNPDEIEAYFFHHKLVKQIHTWGETTSNIRRML